MADGRENTRQVDATLTFDDVRKQNAANNSDLADSMRSET